MALLHDEEAAMLETDSEDDEDGGEEGEEGDEDGAGGVAFGRDGLGNHHHGEVRGRAKDWGADPAHVGQAAAEAESGGLVAQQPTDR
jgi:hypothetical protein